MSRRSRNQRLCLWSGTLLGAALLLLSPLTGHASADNAIQATILPQRFVRKYDPITVVFQQPVGPANAGPVADGEQWLQLQPQRNGTYRWIDQRTLEFRPVAPWPGYQRVQASVPSTCPNKQIKARIHAAPRVLYTLLSSPTSVSPKHGAQDQRNIKKIELTFAQQLPIKALRTALYIELSSLPGVGLTGQQRRMDPTEWWLKRVASTQTSQTTYQVLFRRALPKATSVRLNLRLSLPATRAGKSLQQPVWSSHFGTMRPFHLVGVRCDKHTTQLGWGQSKIARARALDCGGDAAVPALIFSRPLSTTTNPGSLRELIRINPIVPNLKLRVDGQYVHIHGHFKRDALYRLTVQGGNLPIFDNAKQRLQHQGRQTLFFFLGQKRPFITWRTGKGLLERHGPQMMPLHARSISRVDVRIHPIKPTDRRYWPFPSSAISIDENAAPPKAGTATSSTSSNNAIARVATTRRHQRHQRPSSQNALLRSIRLLGTPLFSGILDLPADPQGHGHKFGLDLRNRFHAMLPWHTPKKGVTLPTSNQFLIGLRLLNGSSVRRYVRVQVTDLALTSVEERGAIQFAVTSIQHATPVSDAEVLIEGPTHPLAKKWQILWKGKTDAKGMVRLTLNQTTKGKPMRIRVRKANDQLVLDPHQPPPAFVNHHWSPVSKSWLSWTQSHVTKPIPATVQAHLFTERPVYRPGEPVHIKGIVRTRIAGKLALANSKTGLSLRLDIQGPKQQRWIFDDVKLSESGSLYRKLLPQDAPAGAYQAQLIWMRNDGRTKQLASRTFRIEAYQLPLFEVQVHAPAKVPADKPFRIAATAKYYAGGLVVSQPIKWRVTERTMAYRPAGRKGYHFASSIRYSRRQRNPSKLLVQKSDQINAQGQASLTLDPTKSFDLRARRYTIEAVVKGPDGRDIAGYKRIKVLPPFSIGVKLNDRFRLKPGKIQAQLITVGVKGKLVAGVPLQVQLLRREWHAQLVETDFVQGRTRYRTEVVDRPIAQCKVVTGTADVQCPLQAKAGGVYILQVQARDRMGRLQRVSLDMYVQGKQAIAWERSRNSTFKLSLSKKIYRTGQTAQVLVRSPFQEGKALAIIEDPAGVRYQWLDITKGKGLLSVPIKSRHTPSLQVHLVLLQGRVAQPLKRGLDPGKPKTAVSSIAIPVDPRANRIVLAMNWPKQARPRQWVEGTIQLNTPDGQPLSGEVTLWAVDRAALSLGREERIHPLRSFVTDRGTHLRIRDTRNMVIGRIPRLADRPGGGGGGIGGRRTMVRKNFNTVPYYNHALQVGPSGTLKVRFQLPDDLTTFAIRAVAVSGPERFGYTEKHLLVQLPVMVQRSLPQFVRPGDIIQSGGFARIVSGPAGPAIAQIDTKGIKVIGANKQRFDLHARAATPVTFKLSMPMVFVPDIQVKIQIKRLKDNESDAFQVKIPVKQDRRRIYLLREQQLASLDKTISLLAQWPEKIRPGSGRVEVLLASNDAIIRTVGAMEYLLEYPYGCVEQRVSRARPLLALEGIHRQFALRHLSSKRTADAVKATLQHIQGAIQRDGNVGYWPGSQGSVWLTAYTAAFVLEAKRAGYAFPDKLLDTTLQALRRALRSDIGLGRNRWQLATRAEVLWTLAQAAQHQPAYLRRLYRQRARLDLYGRSRLLLAMQRDRARHINRIKRLTRELSRRIKTSTQAGQVTLARVLFARKGYWHGMLHASRTRTIAGLLEALSVTAPGSHQVSALQDALLHQANTKSRGFGWRNDGAAWGNTQNNAHALLALRSLLEHRIATSATQKFAFQLRRQGQSKWSNPAQLQGKAAWHFATASDVPLELKLTTDTPKQPIWVRARISYVPLQPGKQLPALNKGITVQRVTQVVASKPADHRFMAIKSKQSYTIQQGSMIEEEVRVIVSRRRYHVVIEVPIAAGLTIANPALKTSSSDAKPAQAHTTKPTHIEYLSDRVRFFFDRLPAGVHKMYFRAQAVTVGSYTYPPATASLMYQPTIFGRGPGYTLQVAPAKKP